jgi:hypothetical protein
MVTIKNTIQELQQIILEYTPKISAIPEEEFAAKPLPHKWSKKEVLGHLIDSAQNNLRRFICGQYEESPPHIVYEQDFWVAANGYAHANKEDMIQLWCLINERICSVLDTMPSANYSRTCNTSKESLQLRSLEWLAEDYVKHMKHHINQIIADYFDVIYK